MPRGDDGARGEDAFRAADVRSAAGGRVTRVAGWSFAGSVPLVEPCNARGASEPSLEQSHVSDVSASRRALRGCFGLKRCQKSRQDGASVRDDAEIRDAKDWRIRISVDRDDAPGSLHAYEMLRRTGDSDRDVEVRLHRLAGLPYLIRVRHPARVDDCPRRSMCAVQRCCKLFNEGVSLWL